MSVTVGLSNVTSTSIGSCVVGTVTPATDNSIKASSTAFVVNLVSFLNLIINKVGNIYNTTGIKSFVALYLTGGTSIDPITIGASNATTVNVLPVSATVGTQTISFNGVASLLQSNFAGNTFTRPIVTPNVYNRMINGINSGSSAGTAYTFSGLGYPNFTTAPIFLTTGTNATARQAGAFNVTNTGFTLVAGATQNVTWVAIGN